MMELPALLPPYNSDGERNIMKNAKQTAAECVEQRHQLETAPKRFAGVAGKIIKWMDCALGEDNETVVDIQFEDGEALLITVEAKPTIVAEWRKYEGKDLEPIPDKKIFE